MGFLSETTDLSAYMAKATYDVDATGKADHIDGPGGLPAQCFDKAVSDNLRHSHDAETTTTDHVAYVKVKTITFTRGIKGILRVKFHLGTNNASYLAYGRIYKNGVALGTAQSTLTVYTPSPELFSEDLDVGTIAVGETLELWAKATDGYESRTSNFRVYYDNDAGAIVPASSNS